MTQDPPKILVAHGSATMREGLAGILARQGYAVERAYNLARALVVLGAGDVDVLLVGVHLPPAGCLGLLDACPGPPPTIVLGETGTHLPEPVQVDPRVLGVLPQPYSLRGLLDMIEKAIAGSRP